MIAQTPWMSLVEGRAYRRLRQLRTLGLWDGTLPIPIDHVLEHLLHMTVSWEDVEEHAKETVLACLRPDTREVVLNERHVALFRERPGLERFCKAHEAGHADVFALPDDRQVQLLGKCAYSPQHRSAAGGNVTVISARLGQLEPSIRHEVWRRLQDRERERRIRGADSGLERRSVDHYAAVLLMPADLMCAALRGKQLGSWPVLYRLAERCGVTISALVVRLQEIGLIYGVENRRIIVGRERTEGQLNLL